MHLLTWPNLISLTRLPLAAAFLLTDSPLVRAIIVAAAAASDGLDGWVARRFGQTSAVGEILDPVTDRLFVAVALIVFTVEGQLAPWALGLLLLRDAYTLVAGVVTFVMRWPIRLRARWSGKVVTVFQFATVIALLIRPAWGPGLAIAAGIAGAVAIIDYTRNGLHDLRRAQMTS